MMFTPPRPMRIFFRYARSLHLEKTGKMLLCGSVIEVYPFEEMIFDHRDKLAIPFDGGYLLVEDLSEEASMLAHEWTAFHEQNKRKEKDETRRRLQEILDAHRR